MVIVALVPMRHHSERVPRKNCRPFNGEPLYRYIVRSLLHCSNVDEVVIDTESARTQLRLPWVGKIWRPIEWRLESVVPTARHPRGAMTQAKIESPKPRGPANDRSLPDAPPSGALPAVPHPTHGAPSPAVSMDNDRQAASRQGRQV